MRERILLRKYSIFLLLAMMLCILQQAIFSRIEIFSHSMDVVYVFLVCFSLLMDDLDSFIFALMCGLLRDSFFPYIFGLNTILFITSAFIISHINRRIYKDTLFIPVFVSLGATIFKGLIYFSYLFISSIRFDFMSHTINVLVYESLINAALSIVLFRIAKKILHTKAIQQEWKF